MPKSDDWDDIEKFRKETEWINKIPPEVLKERMDKVKREMKHDHLMCFLTGWSTSENSFGHKETKKLGIRERLCEFRSFLIFEPVSKNYMNMYDEEVSFYIITCPAGNNWKFSINLSRYEYFSLDITIPYVISITYHVWENENNA